MLKDVSNLAIDINDLTNEIVRNLRAYTDEVSEGVEKLTKDAAKSAVAKLKAQSPKDTHDYSKGWRAKKEGSYWRVHNATDWQLTHLLEEGHATKDGDRIEAQEHIAPVRDEIAGEVESKIAEVVRG